MKKQKTAKSESNKFLKGLPNPETWAPKDKAAPSLASAFSNRCAIGEENLLRSLQHEKSFSVENFDSGLPFESAVRDEIRRLIPKRYETVDGHLVDRNGMSAGQCDIVIFNGTWFNPVNAPVSSQPNRVLLPVEGAYAVGEVKQHLTASKLDDAMEKLVICQRLHRPATYANRFTENRDGSSCNHGLTNPLFTFIIAGGVDNKDFDSLIHRFFKINQKLKRLELVRCLCVLGSGAVTWAFADPLRGGEIRPALFMKDDLFHRIVPAFAPNPLRPSLYSLMQILHLHLYHSILAPEDVATAYGSTAVNIKLPSDLSISLPPDKEWSDRLERPCEGDLDK